MEILLGLIGVLVVAALLAVGALYLAGVVVYLALRAVSGCFAVILWLIGELLVLLNYMVALAHGTFVEGVWLAGRFAYGCAGLVGGVFRVDIARERLSAVDAAWRMDVGLAPPGPLPDWCLSPGGRKAVDGASGARAAAPEAQRTEDASENSARAQGSIAIASSGGAKSAGPPQSSAAERGGGPKRGVGDRRSVSGRGLSAFSFEVAYIPPGEFQMGSPSSEEGRYDGEDLHHVRLTRGFEIGVVPVTQALYGALMGTNPSTCKGDPAQLPVETISWFDAVRFCNAVSRACGLPDAYNIGAGREPTVTWDQASGGFRVPTEAEWEYAARAGTRYRYAGGDELAAVGWFEGNSGGSTRAVGQKRANGWGLHDMSGNVWEWCWDWRGAYSSGRVVDPVGPASGAYRVNRGGSWSVGPLGARVAYRLDAFPGYRSINLGVRLVRTAP
ncbi:MAG: formylglycine-generating enzyme family protein [Deltaproteobacteria bacterium]|nr:formylglycine-generating enzyme family protein [Deltaproteobacteria bacterium]